MARAGKRHGLEPSASSLDIHSVSEFQAILKYERARTDRAGSRFALVAFEVAAIVGDTRELSRLTRALQERIRTVDVLGCLDGQTLGVLLPCTDLQGGWIFAVNFQKRYYEKHVPAPFTVYSYPDHWLHNGNGSSAGGPIRVDDGAEKLSSSERVRRTIDGAMARKLPLWKRSMDIAGSIVALVLSSPVFFALAAYIKIVSPGPVFFRQKRVGYRSRPFTFLKFRTMHVNNDCSDHRLHLKELIGSDKPMEKLDDGRDPRIIPGGRLIRKACLDELPQLVNVLKGEMTLVGPRPCLPYEAADYLRWHKNRFDALPGMTGLWQVSGKNNLSFKQMIRLDISYSRDLSIWLDLKILLLTPLAIAGFVLEAVLKRLRGHSPEAIRETVTEPLAICQVLEYFAERF